MLFKDIKQNYPVYILDKAEMTFQQGKVTSVSLPRMNMQKQYTYSLRTITANRNVG